MQKHQEEAKQENSDDNDISGEAENDIDKKLFSIRDLQKMSTQDLDQLVIIKTEENNVELKDIDPDKAEFYQVKVQKITIHSMPYNIIQIIDITSRIRFQKLIGEKNLLQMINACVSHEMRNPINSIMG